MTEPTGPRWRGWAALALLVSVPVAAFLVYQPEPQAPETPAQAQPKPTPTVRPPILPRPDAPVSRAELIEAAAQAASAFAAGQPPPTENIQLAGRRFALQIPFGCGGPDDPEELGAAGWSYDAETQTLRAQVTPQVWTEAPWVEAVAGDQEFEAIEGFWIDRPWLRTATCPVVTTPPPAPAPVPAPEATPPAVKSPAPTTPATIRQIFPPRETLAIARLFEPGSKRAARRNGNPYTLSAKVPPENAPGPQGLRLLVEGRLAADVARSPIGCWANSPDLRPLCAIRARVDRVAVTNPTGETVFAEWRY